MNLGGSRSSFLLHHELAIFYYNMKVLVPLFDCNMNWQSLLLFQNSETSKR